MHVGAAEFFGANHFSRRCFYQRGPTQGYRALTANDNRLIRHRRHIGATGRTGPHNHRDLRNSKRRHIGLVVENPTEVITIGENLILIGQIRTTRINEVDAGQVVLLGDLLCPNVFLDGHRVVRTAFNRGVIGNDHALMARNAPDACDNAGRRDFFPVHPMGRELGELEKRRAHID